MTAQSLIDEAQQVIFLTLSREQAFNDEDVLAVVSTDIANALARADLLNRGPLALDRLDQQYRNAAATQRYIGGQT